MFRACPSRWWTACRASSPGTRPAPLRTHRPRLHPPPSAPIGASRLPLTRHPFPRYPTPETATATWWRGTCARGARCGAYPRTRHPPARCTRNSRRARPRACSRKGATAPSSAGEPPAPVPTAIRARPRAPRRAGPCRPDPTTTASSRRGGGRLGTVRVGRLDRSSPSPGRRNPPWTSARCRRLTTMTTTRIRMRMRMRTLRGWVPRGGSRRSSPPRTANTRVRAARETKDTTGGSLNSSSSESRDGLGVVMAVAFLPRTRGGIPPALPSRSSPRTRKGPCACGPCGGGTTKAKAPTTKRVNVFANESRARTERRADVAVAGTSRRGDVPGGGRDGRRVRLGGRGRRVRSIPRRVGRRRRRHPRRFKSPGPKADG